MATATTKSSNTKPAGKFNVPKGNQVFLFDKSNYTWMIAGLVLILLGLLLMAGGKSPDPNKFNYDDLYSFRRITLAPVIMMIGFALEAYAIMKKPATPDNQ